jgi:hypothetical protein
MKISALEKYKSAYFWNPRTEELLEKLNNKELNDNNLDELIALVSNEINKFNFQYYYSEKLDPYLTILEEIIMFYLRDNPEINPNFSLGELLLKFSNKIPVNILKPAFILHSINDFHLSGATESLKSNLFKLKQDTMEQIFNNLLKKEDYNTIIYIMSGNYKYINEIFIFILLLKIFKHNTPFFNNNVFTYFLKEVKEENFNFVSEKFLELYIEVKASKSNLLIFFFNNFKLFSHEIKLKTLHYLIGGKKGQKRFKILVKKHFNYLNFEIKDFLLEKNKYLFTDSIIKKFNLIESKIRYSLLNKYINNFLDNKYVFSLLKHYHLLTMEEKELIKKNISEKILEMPYYKKLLEN